MDRRNFVLAAFALGGCATIARGPAVAPGPRVLDELEPLYSVKSDPEGLTIEVASGGCTTKADFSFFLERLSQPPALAFGRKHVETCKSSRKLQTALTFSWEELGLSPKASVLVLNPLAGSSLPAS